MLVAEHRLLRVQPVAGGAFRHPGGHGLDVGLLRADVLRQRQLREQQRQHREERGDPAVEATAQHGQRTLAPRPIARLI
jgi:hypothetical protein